MPDSTPFVSIDAIPGLLLVHMPPGVTFESDVVAPVHNVIEPKIGVGAVLIVTIAEVKQPVVTVYVILAVPPATPDTIPEVFTVALLTSLLVHDNTPGVVLERLLEAPTHMLMVPVIGLGVGFTVTITERVHVLGPV